MTEHHEITGLTFTKTQEIGKTSFSGLEGSDYSAGVSSSAQKRRKYNDPSMKGPSSSFLGSRNPLDIFNKVTNTDLNPPSVSFSLQQTETLKKRISKKRRDEVCADVDIKIQSFEFGPLRPDAYRQKMGLGQLVMLDAPYWGKSTELYTQSSDLRRAKLTQEHNVKFRSSPHAHAIGMVNQHLQAQLEAASVEEAAVLLERHRPVGVLKNVTMQQYGILQKIFVQMFGTVRGSINLFNYWMLCAIQPRAGVHLWFTLVCIREKGKDEEDGEDEDESDEDEDESDEDEDESDEDEDEAKQYYQWLPCTTRSWKPPSKKKEDRACMHKYLNDKTETITQVVGSIHVGKATNTHCLQNPDHYTSIVKKMTREGGADREVLKNAFVSQLYLKDALLC